MNPLQSLLELQGLDTRIAQLEHRREQVPERDELRLLKQESVALGERLVAAQTLHHELERRQKRYDDDLSSVLAKREQENRLLYSGQVTGIRELQSLEEEVAALGRRQRVVEDKLLEVMEQLEPSVADLEDLQRRGEDLLERTEGAKERLAAATAEIDEESRGGASRTRRRGGGHLRGPAGTLQASPSADRRCGGDALGGHELPGLPSHPSPDGGGPAAQAAPCR